MFTVKRKGRHKDFRCSICGKFVPYDRRKTTVTYKISCGYSYDGDPYPIEEVIITHKTCLHKEK